MSIVTVFFIVMCSALLVYMYQLVRQVHQSKKIETKMLKEGWHSLWIKCFWIRCKGSRLEYILDEGESFPARAWISGQVRDVSSIDEFHTLRRDLILPGFFLLKGKLYIKPKDTT